MRVNSASACFEGKFITMGEKVLSSGDVIKRAGFIAGPHFNLLDNDIEQYPGVRRDRTWAATSDETLKEVKLAPEGARPRPAVQTLADVLVALHKRAKTQIVSDAFRVPCSIGWATGESIQDVLDKIAAFSAMRFRKGEVVFRSREGWIEGRHIQGWRLHARAGRNSRGNFGHRHHHGKIAILQP